MSLNHVSNTSLPRYPSSNFEGKNTSLNYKDYYRWMVRQLTPRITSLSVALLGNPYQKRENEWRWGKKGEIVVYVAGPKIGRFCDFESGVSGDALNLIEYKTGYQGKELSDWVRNFIGYNPKPVTQEKKQSWVPIIPVPEEAFAGDITKGLMESFQRKGMVESGRYCYRSLAGDVLGYVVRFENAEEKMTLPLTYCVNEKGMKAWKWKGFPVPRLPYGSELLKNSNNKILIVEGEKKCNVAREIFPLMTVITWIAGTGSVHLTDWSSLAGRDIVLWPDNDNPGHACMAKLKSILEGVEAETVCIVSLPNNTPESWDLADTFPEGWDQLTLYNLVNNAV